MSKVRCIPEINGVRLEVFGVRTKSGKRVAVRYSFDQVLHAGVLRRCVTIRCRRYSDSLPRELGDVQNRSNAQIDYFEKDRVRFYASDEGFPAALQAWLNAQAAMDRRSAKRQQRVCNAAPASVQG